MARTTAQLIVVGAVIIGVILFGCVVVASFEPVVRTVVLDFIEKETFIVNERVVTRSRAEDDMTLRPGIDFYELM